MNFDFKGLQEIDEREKRLFQSKEYLTSLSTDEKGKKVATKKDTLKMILQLIDEKGLEKAIYELGVPPFWIDEIINNRKELEQDFELVLAS